MEKYNDITKLTVVELSGAIARRELSSREVTDAYLERIDDVDGDIGSYITVTRDTALCQAERADEYIRNNEEIHPLSGIPYSLKDNINVAGIKTTCASKMLADFVSPYSASVYEKLDGVGGVLLGKTNLDEFAMGSSCEKSYFGQTKNPLDTERSPGGSSGGSAAAVAGKMSPYSIGTDTGGSTRQPASFCTLVAMKPTYGLVSRYGVVEFASSLDTVSPITRDVYDNALVLSAMAGRDPRDMTSIDPTDDFLERIGDGVRGLKIGFMRDFDEHCTARAAESVGRAAMLLESIGADVEFVRLPSTDLSLNTYMVIAAAECSSNLARFDGLKYSCAEDGDSYAEIMTSSRMSGFGDEVKRRIITGAYALSSTYKGDYYRKIKAAQLEICKMTENLFKRYDMILTPTAAGKAFRLDSFDEDPTEIYGSDRFTILANLTGCPAITIPCGGNGEMPYGVMLMGPRLSEAKLYRAAYALEEVLKPYVKREVRDI